MNDFLYSMKPTSMLESFIFLALVTRKPGELQVDLIMKEQVSPASRFCRVSVWETLTSFSPYSTFWMLPHLFFLKGQKVRA